MSAPEPTDQKALGARSVGLRFGFSRQTLYRLLREDPTFPRPRRLLGAKGDPRWDVGELDAWWASLPRS